MMLSQLRRRMLVLLPVFALLVLEWLRPVAISQSPVRLVVIGSGPPGNRKPDNNEYDGYLLAAYRLPFWGLEPFAYGEYNHFVSPYGDEQIVIAGGLNIHFTEFAQLKTEIARVLFFDLDADGPFSDNNMTLLFSRLAVAF